MRILRRFWYQPGIWYAWVPATCMGKPGDRFSPPEVLWVSQRPPIASICDELWEVGVMRNSLDLSKPLGNLAFPMYKAKSVKLWRKVTAWEEVAQTFAESCAEQARFLAIGENHLTDDADELELLLQQRDDNHVRFDLVGKITGWAALAKIVCRESTEVNMDGFNIDGYLIPRPTLQLARKSAMAAAAVWNLGQFTTDHYHRDRLTDELHRLIQEKDVR